MRKSVTILENQSLFDLSIQVYGSIESVFDLLLDNPLRAKEITDMLNAGEKLDTNRDPKDLEMVNFYTRNSYLPANGIPARVAGPPIVISSGDYNNDYNNDYLI